MDVMHLPVTHLQWLLPCYALGVLVPAALAAGAVRRLGVARRRLAALDPRGQRP